MKILAFVLLLFVSSFCAAEGWYLGAGVGESNMRSGCATMPSNVWYSCDDDSTAWSVFLGRRVAQHLSIEAGYIDFGEARTTGAAELIGGNRVLPRPWFPGQVVQQAAGEWKAQGIDVAAVGDYPIGNGFSLLGRASALLWDAQYTTNIPGDVASYSRNGISLGLGAGIGVSLHKRVSLRAMWIKYWDVDRTDIDTLSFGGAFHF